MQRWAAVHAGPLCPHTSHNRRSNGSTCPDPQRPSTQSEPCRQTPLSVQAPAPAQGLQPEMCIRIHLGRGSHPQGRSSLVMLTPSSSTSSSGLTGSQQQPRKRACTPASLLVLLLPPVPPAAARLLRPLPLEAPPPAVPAGCGLAEAKARCQEGTGFVRLWGEVFWGRGKGSEYRPARVETGALLFPRLD